MKQFDFFTPNTTLTLAYTFEYFPYNFFGKYDHVLKGIYHEPWNMITEKTGVAFRNQYGNYFDMLDEILNGSIMTTLDAVTKINESNKFSYSYSVPFYFSTYGIYEARRPLQKSESLEMFAVFDPSAWALLIGLAIAAKLINMARVYCRRGQKETTRIPTMIYLFAIIIAFAIHSAGFKGNTVLTTLTATSYTQLVTDLRSGRRQLVLQPTLTNPLANGIDYMLSNKSRPVLSMEPTEYRLAQVCTNQDYVTRIFTLDLVVLQSVELSCTLDRIFIDDSPMGLNATYNEEFDINLPFMIIFKRQAVTKRSLDLLNQILLRMFREEQDFTERLEDYWLQSVPSAFFNIAQHQCERLANGIKKEALNSIRDLWTPRFIRSFATKTDETTQGKGLEYKPISLDTYLPLLPLFISLYLLALILLASEFSLARKSAGTTLRLPCHV